MFYPGLTTRFFFLLLLFAGYFPLTAHANKCLFVSSYHQGYAWSDGVERGIRSILEGKCEIRQFNMDTKRNKHPEHMKKAGLEVKQLIDSWKPDIVITADDNAAKYVIQAHYKDHEVPFVFCGVNWTADEYGFPYSNVTGMVEVAPIYPLIEKVKDLIPDAKRAIYLGADTVTEKKNLARFEKALSKSDIHLDSALVETMHDWLSSYTSAQQYDFVIVGSNSGIYGWNSERVINTIRTRSKKLTVTNHDWMMPYTMLGFTKVPEEHGEWAAQAALSILAGVQISKIAIIPNRKWDIWTNSSLLQAANIMLPERLILKSKQVQ
jgi:ABC-type uncharacterized transport system substrate-binding protein